MKLKVTALPAFLAGVQSLSDFGSTLESAPLRVRLWPEKQPGRECKFCEDRVKPQRKELYFYATVGCVFVVTGVRTDRANPLHRVFQPL